MAVRPQLALYRNPQVQCTPQTVQSTREIAISSVRLATNACLNATYHMDGPQWLASLWQKRLPGRISRRRDKMLWTITIVLFVLWLLGMVSSYTLGGWIHLLLVLAVIVLIFNLLSGRRAV
jgi:hypothetical protein